MLSCSTIPKSNVYFLQNAEISLGTITDLQSARHWLAGTFFNVRLRKNAEYYGLAKAALNHNFDNELKEICSKDVSLLQEWGLCTSDFHIKITDYGDAMARYYIRFETMKKFLSLPRASSVPELVCLCKESLPRCLLIIG